jgi:molybdenum cofactor cytidylyltransferase
VPVTQPPPSRVFAIVPAAGQSRRMGRPKQLLELGGRPMLLATIEPLAAAEIAGVLVVTHRLVAEQVGAALPRGVRLVRNDDENSEMIDSVRIGLRAWFERGPVAEYDGFLVCPADQPGIRTADFNSCVRAFQSAPERIVVAARAGRRGHPIIFPAALAAFIQSAACDPGLNALPHAFPASVLLVTCRSRGVTADVDTPGDCGRVRGPRAGPAARGCGDGIMPPAADRTDADPAP